MYVNSNAGKEAAFYGLSPLLRMYRVVSIMSYRLDEAHPRPLVGYCIKNLDKSPIFAKA